MPNQTTIVVRLGFVYFVSDKQNQINQEQKPYYVFSINTNYGWQNGIFGALEQSHGML